MTIRAIFYWFALTLVLSACKEAEPIKVEPSKKYNVVFVIVDDLNDWVEPLGGHPQAITPNFNRLASESITFTNAYAAAPACNPSRVAMLTGIQPYKSGVYSNSDHLRQSERLKNTVTLPQLFKQNGYKTMSIGKVFHQPDGPLSDPVSWSHIQPEKGNLLRVSSKVNDGVLANGMPYTNGVEKLLDWDEINVSLNETSDYINAQWASEVIQTTRTPYFLACGIYKPHLPWYLPEGYLNDWHLDSLRLGPFDENDLSDLPSGGLEVIRNGDSESDFNRLTRTELHKEATRAYLASMKYADDCLGVLLDAVDNQNDSTILIVLGDHGWHLREKQHYRKFTLWERATHVPLFIRLPEGKNGGQKTDALVSLVDIYPTISAYCGVEFPKDLDGENLITLLSNPSLKDGLNRSVTSTLTEGSTTVRYQDWRYIKYADGGEELYDHNADPNEWNNLAENTDFKNQLNIMRELMPTSWAKSVSGKGHLIGLKNKP